MEMIPTWTEYDINPPEEGAVSVQLAVIYASKQCLRWAPNLHLWWGFGWERDRCDYSAWVQMQSHSGVFVCLGASPPTGAATLRGGDQGRLRIRFLHQGPREPRRHSQRCLQTVTGISSVHCCASPAATLSFVFVSISRICLSNHTPPPCQRQCQANPLKFHTCRHLNFGAGHSKVLHFCLF